MKKQLFIISAVLIGSFALLSMTTFTSLTQDPWEVPAKYEKMENPFASDADAESVGRMLYSKHCKSCHGSKGLGDGSKAETVDTEMPDISTDAFKAQSDGAIYYKTFIGRDDMPSFQKKISDEKEQWLLVNYVKNL
jgi:mono/diheme cytochrome c family protein